MNSEMILYIKSAFAQNEALTYSNRLSMSYRMKMEDGTFITYHAPFGYRLEGQQLVVVPEEADIIKRIFELYLSGCGISKITGIMNQIAKLASQSDMYHKLHSKNIMDDVSFAERIADVQERLTTLRTRRMKLLSEDDESRCIEQLHQLQDTLEELPKALLTFQADVFEAIIDKIKVDEKMRITFVMKGGLRLAEPARRMAG